MSSKRGLTSADQSKRLKLRQDHGCHRLNQRADVDRGVVCKAHAARICT